MNTHPDRRHNPNHGAGVLTDHEKIDRIFTVAAAGLLFFAPLISYWAGWI